MRVRDVKGMTNREIVDKLHNNGSKYLGSGSCRVVYAFSPRRAIKLADSLKGIAQNKREVEVSKKHGNTGYFARVIWYEPKYRWVIVERVIPWRGQYSFDFDTSEITKFCHKAKIWDTQILFNWGKIGRRNVLCDYGLSPAIFREFYDPFR